ncbi:MAG: YceI family protein [Bacteroidota bacterium]
MFRIIIFCLSLTWAQKRTVVPLDTETAEKLIVFLQAEKDQSFEQENLPQLKRYCQSNQIELIVKSAEEGLPEEISSTPAIVFQTDNKRLIYAGRYQEFSSIENFIRTGRFRNPVQSSFCKEAVWLKQEGRTQLMAVAKLTQLSGSLAAGFEEERFAKQAFNAISQGLSQFEQKSQACISQTDRIFYLDFHPYRAENAQLFLSLELYSQFSCIDPVYRLEGLRVPANDWDALFAEAGRQFAQQIELTLAKSKIGDALSSVANDIPFRTWESLGLAFPAGVKNPKEEVMNLDQLAGVWTYTGVPDARIPALSFHFQAPLERYAGEVSQLAGQLRFDEANRLLSGDFTVEVSSLSMGMADLDEKVLRKYLKAKKFPEARFQFDLKDAPLALNSSAQLVAIPGQFSLMDQRIELPMQAQFQMLTDDAGQPQLWANGQFSLNISQDFGIEGPDGPSPSRETMIFYFSLLLNS